MSRLAPLSSNYPLRPLKFVAPLRGVKVDVVPAGGEYIGLEQIESWTGKLSGAELQSHPEGGANRFCAGDVLFGKLRPYLAKAWAAERDGYCTAECLVLAPENADARFVRYCLLTQEVISSVDGSTFGSKMPRADWTFIGNVQIPAPRKQIQTQIANFLDEQTARIDALIAEKTRLATTLRQLRSESIDRAVLGLDIRERGAALKGLEILGSIPEGWTSSRMKFELEYVTSGSRGWADFYADDGALFVRIGNLTRDSIGLKLDDIQRVTLPEEAEGTRARVRPGDLLISITAYLGSVAVAPLGIEEAYVSQHVSLARPNKCRARPQWLGYVVLSSVGRTFFDLQAYGGTKVQLSLDDIRELPVPLPSPGEQDARILQLERRLAQLGELATHAEEHIDRLREYRSSLISAAVTGQLDINSYEEAA